MVFASVQKWEFAANEGWVMCVSDRRGGETLRAGTVRRLHGGNATEHFQQDMHGVPTTDLTITHGGESMSRQCEKEKTAIELPKLQASQWLFQ